MTQLKKMYIPIFMVVLIYSFLLGGCTPTEIAQPVTKTNFLLGTMVTITIYDPTEEDVFDEIFSRINNIEKKMSINIEDSEVIDINKHSGMDFIRVSDETFEVIKKGKYYSKLSDGNFDITIGPIVKLWNIGTDKARIPSDEEISQAVDLVDYNEVLLDPVNHSIMLNRKNMVMDLGAIAKGYVADETKKILENHGIKNAIINLGGNVYVMGTKPNSDHWNVGIQNPFEPRGENIGIVAVSNKSVVTSGIYERFFMQDDVRYHHILSPFTGYPVDNNLAGVTIISDQSIDGDALSTTAFSLGIEKGMALIEGLEGIDALFVTRDREIYSTSGLKDIFELTDTQFTIKN